MGVALNLEGEGAEGVRIPGVVPVKKTAEPTDWPVVATLESERLEVTEPVGDAPVPTEGGEEARDDATDIAVAELVDPAAEKSRGPEEDKTAFGEEEGMEIPAEEDGGAVKVPDIASGEETAGADEVA